ncbi:hypothetical protein TNCV_730731 [Trichonephila clavipes]|nr:hypothetical protein TNCV_730731 [Trichonephila clavipes]
MNSTHENSPWWFCLCIPALKDSPKCADCNKRNFETSLIRQTCRFLQKEGHILKTASIQDVATLTKKEDEEGSPSGVDLSPYPLSSRSSSDAAVFFRCAHFRGATLTRYHEISAQNLKGKKVGLIKVILYKH